MVYGVNDMAVRPASPITYRIDRRDPASQCGGVVQGYAQTAQRWPALAPARRAHGPSELGSPRLASRLKTTGGDLAGHGARRAIGQLIDLRVRIVDEDGAPLPGAMVEIWHCNAAGKYLHPNDTNDAPADPNFYGAARLAADETGRIALRTVKPAAYPVADTDGWWRPPHIHFSVWGRVWLSRLVTQMFFPGEPLNALDPILNAVPDAAARERCIARFLPQAGSALVFEHQLVVRGREASPEMR
jgi:protocatechuate 3,4-dioxygenase, beta subunit